MFGEVGTVVGFLLLVLCYMGMYVFLGWWKTRVPIVTKSPYTNLPLVRLDHVPYNTKLKIALFLYELKQYDNRPFKFQKAALCRETGRIFQNSVNWKGGIDVDWTFLQKRYPGNWISWGSLSSELKEKIRNRHENLDGFQSEYSSERPSPLQVETKYALAQPGPLYVDIDTGVLLGWKEVPETLLEVLIVQKPIR